MRGRIELLYRPGCNEPRDIQRDYVWLMGFGLLMIATGIGLRDPWPADEPRFALIARDMAASSEWLLPRVGGDIYAEKPPLYLWLLALGVQSTGSLRTFLLPSLCSGLACVALVYDLARRLWNRETGLIAGFTLLLTVQFVWQARQAQIDATLCFWTTLGLYGLLRHLLLGPQWRWYLIGCAAAGFGVITKGVGFLPLLVSIPFVLLRDARWAPRMPRVFSLRWLLGPVMFALAVGVWVVPMVWAARTDPTLAAYRDEILFRQTLDRYANAWHHREPVWYFLLEVIPWLWLPLTALLPWLAPRWRTVLRQFDLRIALLLSWVLLVVLFFSVSTGKRGVYVLPAVPAFVLACAPFIAELARQRAVQRTLFWIAAVLGSLCAAASAWLFVVAGEREKLIATYDLDVPGPLLLIACATALVCAVARPARGFPAFAGTLVVVLLVVSFWVNPAMNAARSGASLMAEVSRHARPDRPLGFVEFKEQHLLHVQRQVVHFGHARWLEPEAEAADAALWLVSARERQLVINDRTRRLCFQSSQLESLGVASRTEWFLVRSTADPDCIARGNLGAVRYYQPPSLPQSRE